MSISCREVRYTANSTRLRSQDWDENSIIVSIEPKPREIVARILSALNMVEDALPPKQTSVRPSGPGG
jgi:hypothetical protein